MQPPTERSTLVPADGALAGTGQHPGPAAPAASPPSAEPDLRIGARPVPEHTLLCKLGEGGFGQVWKARDDDGFEVALKFLRLDGCAGATELRALEVMRNVRHPHVLPMFRSWQVGGWFVLALELGDKTLLHRLAEVVKDGHVGIPRPELLQYVHEAAQALDYLHTLNIQHRDVKPQNLLLVGGCVKVADFGLAKLMEGSQASNSGSMTPAYAAPEQFQGLVSPHSDQYSLAVSYCQLRGGRLPYPGSHHEVMFGHVHGQPDTTMLPEAERPVLARALSKKPDERWPSCREFAEALVNQVQPVESVQTSPALHTTTAHAARTKRRHAVSAVLAALTVLAIGGILLMPPRRPADAGITISEDAGADPLQPLDCTGETGVSAAGVRQSQEARARLPGREVEETVAVAGGVNMTFVLVPPGKFLMGSPEGEKDRDAGEVLHTVVLTEPFDLARHEVTQAQYEALTGNNPGSFKGRGAAPWSR